MNASSIRILYLTLLLLLINPLTNPLTNALMIRLPSHVRVVVTSTSTRLLSSSSPTPFQSYLLSSPQLVTAPMVAQSDYAFRSLTRLHGSTLCYTQMLHARNFVESQTFRADNYDFRRGHEGLSHGRPVVAQVAGDDPGYMSEAARLLSLSGADAVDVNLGCPQGIARKGNYGAYLLPQTDRVCEIVRAMRRAVGEGTAVTAKIRLEKSLEETMTTVEALVESGVEALAVHGRTAGETKTRQGPANWDAVRAVVEACPVPVIANGGVEWGSDVGRALAATGAAGVMSSEALLENPSLFGGGEDDGDMRPGDVLGRQLDLCDEYLSLAAAFPPVGGGASGGHGTVKAHVFKIIYRVLCMEGMHDLREGLGERKCRFEDTLEIVAEARRR